MARDRISTKTDKGRAPISVKEDKFRIDEIDDKKLLLEQRARLASVIRIYSVWARHDR